MPTECSAERFEFEPVEGRKVVSGFDGGAITSDAGALLLGAADRVIGLVGRFAQCFRDVRRPELIEHEVKTLLGQRVFGIALGYEDLNDHDDLPRPSSGLRTGCPPRRRRPRRPPPQPRTAPSLRPCHPSGTGSAACGHARARARSCLSKSGAALTAEDLPHLGHVLVAAPRQGDEHGGPGGHRSAPASRTSQASAWAGSRAGMIPRSRQQPEGGQHLVVAGRGVLGPADGGQVGVLGADARVVEPGRDRVRPRGSGRPRPGAGSDCMPWTTPGTPRPIAAPPAASTPTSRAAVSTKPAKVPAAFEPPPTQATTKSGSAPPSSGPALLARLVADDPLELAHHPRVRVRSHDRAEAVVGVSTVATQSRRASLTASFKVRLPRCTGRTSAPSSSMRNTLSAWRSVSTSPMYTVHSMPNRAAAVAVATPCWPAPVSAMSRVLPMRRASSAWPMTLLSLCEPVWARSSRLSRTRTPEPLGQPAALGDRRGPAAVVAQQGVELGVERRVGPGVAERTLELDARRHERLGHEAAAELAEAAGGAGSPISARRRSLVPASRRARSPLGPSVAAVAVEGLASSSGAAAAMT